jgi:hypothetical protein
MTDDRRQHRRRAEDAPISGQLTEEERLRLAEEIADRVAERAYARFQLEVGRSVIKNLIWLLALGAAALVALYKYRPGDLP